MQSSWAALVLAGGRGARLGGADKAALRVGEQSLLDRALTAAAGASEAIVVGPSRPAAVPVRFVREEPAGAGPAAALLAGLAALPRTDVVVVLAVDMPFVTAVTIARLVAAVDGHDGAVLFDGRRQYLAAAYDVDALLAAAPRSAEGLSMRRLTAPLDLVEVPAEGPEACDVDTPRDLRLLRRDGAAGELLSVNLHDWIDELCDVLDIEVDVDEALVLDLARDAAHNVERAAAPISTFLLGYAAATSEGDQTELERLAAAATDLAARWDKPADAVVEESDDAVADADLDDLDDGDDDEDEDDGENNDGDEREGS